MKKRMFDYAKHVFIILMLFCLVFASVGCKRKIVHTGFLDDNTTKEDLTLKGKVKWTVINDSQTEEGMVGYRSFAKAFEMAYPGTRVIVEEGQLSTYDSRISSGDIGDVFWVSETNSSVYVREQKVLMPLDAYLKPLGIDTTNVYTGAFDCGKIDGRLYYAPKEINLAIMAYNADILEADGFSFDNTKAIEWEEFKSMCKKLTHDTDNDGVFEQVGCTMQIGWAPIYQMFLRGFGGQWIDSKNHVVTIASSTEVMAGINEIVNAVKEGWMYPQDINLSGSIKDQFANIPNGISNASSVGFRSCHYFQVITFGNAYDNLEIEWDLCPTPAFPTQNISCGSTGFAVYNRTTNPDSAAALALFFLTDEGQRAYHSQAGGTVPLLFSQADDSYWKNIGGEWPEKNYDAFVSYTDYTKQATVITQVPSEVDEVINDAKFAAAFASILSGSQDAQTVFGRMEKQANEVWDKID